MDVEARSSGAAALPRKSLRGVATLLFGVAAVAAAVRLGVFLVSSFAVGPLLGFNFGYAFYGHDVLTAFAWVDLLLFVIAIISLIDVARRVRAVPGASVRAARWAGWLSLIDCIYYSGAFAVAGIGVWMFDSDRAGFLASLGFAAVFAVLNSPIIAMAVIVIDRTRPAVAAGSADPPFPPADADTR